MKAESEAYSLGYRVTDDGVLMGPLGVRKPRLNYDGYYTFNFKSGRKNRTATVHRLAAYQHFGDALYAPGIETRHLDSCRTNNCKANIARGTRSDNAFDKPKATRLKQGREAATKLSDEQVTQLRVERDAGATLKILCSKYGLGKSTVSYIVNRRTYTWLP